ncbi:hypothetical protein MEG_00441 [Bartonella tamiae Th307]|nr:hypothetical protein MEG_00441 [Bartonella tamiae Th307]
MIDHSVVVIDNLLIICVESSWGFFSLSDSHKQIRFRKHDIKKLDQFPSANHEDCIRIKTPRLRKKRLYHIRKLCTWLSLTLVIFLLLFFVLLKVGISGAFLTSKMQTVLSRQLKDIADIKVSDVRLSLDENYHIAFEAQNVTLRDIRYDFQVDKIGSIKVGLSSLGLLLGQLQMDQIELHDTNIILPPSKDNNFINKLPKDQFGRIDPDAAIYTLFPSFDMGADALRRMSVDVIVLKNVSFRLPVTDSIPLHIDDLRFLHKSDITTLTSRLSWDGHAFEMMGHADYQNQSAKNIVLGLRSIPLHLGAADGVSPYLPNGQINNGHFRLKGNTDIQLHATRQSITEAPTIELHVLMKKGELDLGVAQNIPANFDITMLHKPQSGNINITHSELTLGGVYLPLEGTIGLLPVLEQGHKPENDYGFNIISNKAVASTRDMPEKPLSFSLNIAGQFNALDKKAIFDQMTIQTNFGNLIGHGNLRFGEGSPETNFSFILPHMDVSAAKQLWPVNIAAGARRWIGANISGGKIENGTIEIALPLGFFRPGQPAPLLSEHEFRMRGKIRETRANLVGDLPSLHDISGTIAVDGATTTLNLKKATAYLSDGKRLDASKGVMVIPWSFQRPVYAEMNLMAHGSVASAGEIIQYKPINARSRLPFDPDKATGDINVELNLRFPVTRDTPRGQISYTADVAFSDLTLAEPMNGILLSQANGHAIIDKLGAKIEASALLNELPANLEIVQPFTNSKIKKSEKISLNIDDNIRTKYFPFLNNFLSGPITVNIGSQINGKRHIQSDLTNADVDIPWIGWKKGKGVATNVSLDIPADISNQSAYTIENFELSGLNLQVNGAIHIVNKKLSSATFTKANLSRNDDISLTIRRNTKSYDLAISGQSFDARALIQKMGKPSSNTSGNEAISIKANIAKVLGFYDEELNTLNASVNIQPNIGLNIEATANTQNNLPVNVHISNGQGQQNIDVTSGNAGAILRFMNYYDKVRGGYLSASLTSSQNTALSGPVRVANFSVVNEDKLAKLVSSSPSQNSRSFNDDVNGQIDSSRVDFDVAFANIGKGSNYLVLDQGVVRGPKVGATFQGIVYDSAGNMSITGTFMPAYGLNRLFGEVPLIGHVLGNGRDRGLFGITFKIEGNTKKPQVIVNPISAIAPGIFRSIFEFQ